MPKPYTYRRVCLGCGDLLWHKRKLYRRGLQLLTERIN